MSAPQGHASCTCRLSATSGGGPHEPGCGALLVSPANAWCVVCGHEIKEPHTECWLPASIASAVTGAQLAAEIERSIAGRVNVKTAHDVEPGGPVFAAHEASPIEDEKRRALIASPELLEAFAQWLAQGDTVQGVPVSVDLAAKARRIIELETSLAAARAELGTYRGRVLEALQAWGERPSDLRSVEQVIRDVELP